MRKLTRPWTDDDTAHLQKLIASGASAMRASIVLKRNQEQIKIRARQLGTPFPNVYERRQLQARAEDEQRRREGLPNIKGTSTQITR